MATVSGAPADSTPPREGSFVSTDPSPRSRYWGGITAPEDIVTADTYDTATAQDTAPATDDQRTGSIVIGTDDPGATCTPARWAADEAFRHQPRLGLVFAYWLHAAGHRAPTPPPLRELDDLRDCGTTRCATPMNTLRRAHPWLTITSRLEYGNPVEVLRERSLNPVLTVIGAHRSDDHSLEGS
jgi:hypothetical protein